MDMKGAYLNGLLSEKVYMRQPKGYDDGTGHACHLIKTLYGFKQAGQEWNRKFDKQLHDKGFKWLKSDPCAYVCGKAKDLSIITVWVDNLLLFTNMNKIMAQVKTNLNSMFELTNMGDPSKIVGIEITGREFYSNKTNKIHRINPKTREYGMYQLSKNSSQSKADNRAKSRRK